MQLGLYKEFYADTHNTIKVLDGLRNVYIGLRRLFLEALIISIAKLFLYFLNYFLKKKIRKYKNAKAININFVSEEEYRLLRIEHNKLGVDLEKLNDLFKDIPKSIQSKGKGAEVRSINLMKEMKQVLEEKHLKDELAFKELDSFSIGKLKDSSGVNFEVVSEQELWSEKPETYKYLI